MTRRSNAILTTLLYSDIFDFPLTKRELWLYLCGHSLLSKPDFERALPTLPSFIRQQDGYFFLCNRGDLVALRKQREKESSFKLRLASQIARFIFSIPTILLIGVSGSVAMKNSRKDDDIDFFIIVRKNTLWLTRLLVVFLLMVTGKLRRRDESGRANTFCINMFMDEQSLSLSSTRRNLYTAHEVVRMVPLYERDHIYKRFLIANKWVGRYLPNSLDTKILRYKDTKREGKKSLNILISQYLNLLEPLAKAVQLWYMRGHRTTEEISDTLLAFHPHDFRPRVLHALEKRLERYSSYEAI